MVTFPAKFAFISSVVKHLLNIQQMKTPMRMLMLFLVSAFLLPCNPANAAAPKIAEISLSPKEVSAESGSPFVLEALVEIAEGWHIYARDNKTFQSRITLNLPEGFILESQTWPNPVKFNAFGEELSGYEKSIKILLKITASPPNDSAPLHGNKKISATLNALACKDVCVPQKASSNTVDVEILRTDAEKGGVELALTMALAFLGGMLLNLMPCVFPVLAIKIMSFAKDAAKGRRGAFVSSLWYAAGIEVSFAVIAAVLIALKAGGAALGWGFQLQNPVFVGYMAVLFTAICMNFAGFFEVGLSVQNTAGKFGGGGAFASGVVAVLVASPCTAPFMGTAVGAALATDADFLAAQAIFLSLGFGMALPYILLSLFPQALKLLPKSGKWLDIFKKVLALPMLATAAWLCWIYFNQTQKALPVLLSVLFTAAACTAYGTLCTPFNNTKTRIKGWVCVCALALASMASIPAGTTFAADKTPPVSAAQNPQTQWSAENVERLLREGKNVFVDFTAKWCLTCKYNERLLKSGEIQRLMARNNTVFLEADWTNRNAAITKTLEKFGRAGVPLYVIYKHKAPKEPQILPSILTESVLKNALENLEN